jgi:hypothetical protein
MRSLRLLTLALTCALLGSVASPVGAQPPVETDEGLIACEDIFVEQCPSHASGGRPEFGPYLSGTPTDVVTVLRVGLRATTFNAAGGVATEMAGHDHAIVRVTATLGDFHVIDLPVIDTDISDCLIAGTNVIQYNPSGTRGSATVLVIIE